MNFVWISAVGLLAFALAASVRLNILLIRRVESEPSLGDLVGALEYRLRRARFDRHLNLFGIRQHLQRCVQHVDAVAERIPTPNEPNKLSATKLAELHNTSAVEIQRRLIDMGYIVSKSGMHYFTDLGLRVGGEFVKSHPDASQGGGHMVWPVDIPLAASN